jgi:putative ABC transport system permease protein
MLWESARADVLGSHNLVSPGNYFDWKAETQTFEDMAAFNETRTVLAIDGRVDELQMQQVSANLLPLLGVSPVRGRWFTPDEDRPGDPTALIISYGVWQESFGGAEDVIGRTVQVNATPRTIVGVMPAGFYFRNRAVQLWQPLRLNPSLDYRKAEGRWVMVIGRLAPGVRLDQAQARMLAVAKRLEATYPAFNTNWSVSLESLRDSLVRDLKTPLLVLLAAVALLLLIACANVAGLLLARQAARQREIAVRGSLGAGTWRLVRQLLTESLVLALAGVAAGLLLAHWLVKGLLAIAPEQLLQGLSIGLDFRIILGGLVLAVVTAVGFGLTPAWVATRSGLSGSLTSESRSHSRGGVRLRSWLVGAEVALSVILVIGALLLFRSFSALNNVSPGLNPANVLTFRISVPPARYRDAARTQFFVRALDRIRQLPGVHSASAVSYLPFRGNPAVTLVQREGQPPRKKGEEWIATIRTVMPDYFRTMGIPIHGGRDFTPADLEPEAPQRFIVNQAFVQTYLRGEQPVGVRINAWMGQTNPFGEIIGVTGDVKEGSLEKPATPTVYYPFAKLPYASMTMVARTAQAPLALAPSIRRAISALDPLQPIADVHSMEEILGDTLARQRISAALLSAFSVSSLLLVAIGLYGLLAYAVSQRTREIGIRIAVGADPSRVVRLIVATGARLVLAGTVVGLAGALALSGFLKSMLFEIAPRDPLTFILVPVLLIIVAVLAAAQPARRAARLNPVDALRTE